MSEKITFGKSAPYNNGWQGWSDQLDILCGGRVIGKVRADQQPQKRYLEYTVDSAHPALVKLSKMNVGSPLGQIKLRVREAFAQHPSKP